MRKHGRTDDNHTAVVEMLRDCGASWQSLADVGGGCPDGLVGYHGRTFIIEIKDGAKPPSRRQLTEDERVWQETWRGDPVWHIEFAEDVPALLHDFDFDQPVWGVGYSPHREAMAIGGI